MDGSNVLFSQPRTLRTPEVNMSVAGKVMLQSSPGMLQGALVEGACLESSVNDGAVRQLTLAPYVQSAVGGGGGAPFSHVTTDALCLRPGGGRQRKSGPGAQDDLEDS